MGQKYEDDKFDGNYADEEDEIVIMIIGDIEKRDKYNVDDEKCDKDRQHCRLSICSYFGWVWQILRRAGLSNPTHQLFVEI